MWLEDLATYIREANLDGIGNNVYVYSLKADEPGVIITTHSNGVLGVTSIPDYYKGVMQIIVRSNHLETTISQATDVMRLLDSRTRTKVGEAGGISLETCVINYMFARHLPVAYSRSDGDYYEASVNFDVCFTDISA